MALYDSLTGLANRSFFDRKLASALQKSQQSQSKLAVLFFDLDRFKTINDTLGHAIGDCLLKEVVARLLSWMRVKPFCLRIAASFSTRRLLSSCHQ